MTFGYDEDAPKALPTSDNVMIAAKLRREVFIETFVYCGSPLERKLIGLSRGSICAILERAGQLSILWPGEEFQEGEKVASLSR